MKPQRFDEYHKHGCHFHGKLVVVDWLSDAMQDPKWGTFNAGLSLEYIKKAEALIREGYGGFEILMSVPELVVRVS